MKSVVAGLCFFAGLTGRILIYGQIMPDINDLPKPGDVQISVTVDSLQGVNLSAGNAGANVLWDFSYLSPCCGTAEASYDTIIWEDHFISQNAASFPLSNILRKDKCVTTHSHDTHQDETNCYYNHYIKDVLGLWFYGMEEPTGFTFNSNWNVLPLLSYGDSLEQTAKIHVPVTADSTLVVHIESITHADAWGTLITPDTTANVLRLFTTETIFDTLFVNGFLQATNTYTGNYYYQWITKNLGFPLLEIGKGRRHWQNPPFFQQVKYARRLEKTSGLGSRIRFYPLENAKIYPNPFSDYITIHFPVNDKASGFTLTLADVMGREIRKVQNVNKSEILMYRVGLGSGIYFLSIRNGEGEIIDNVKLIIE